MVAFDTQRDWPVRESEAEARPVAPRALREILPELLRGYTSLMPNTSPVLEVTAHKGESPRVPFESDLKRAG